MRSIDGFGTALRDPEYTGENRCLPCTVVNVVLAGGTAATVGHVTYPALGAVAFACFMTVIYFRGYLVPGTPTLTRRYLPAPALRLFGKDSTRAETLADADSEWEALVGPVLSSADPVRLDDGFRRRWRRELSDEEPVVDDVAAVLGSPVDEVGPLSYSVDGTRRVRWESETALAADVAAASALRDRYDDWSDADPGTRLDVLRRIRLAAERCPACDGAVDRHRERNETCCRRSRVRLWSECPECDAFLAEIAVPESDAGNWVDDLESDRPTPA